MRDWLFVALLVTAAGLVVAGVATWSTGLALISAGVLLAALAYLVIVVGEAAIEHPEAEAGEDT